MESSAEHHRFCIIVGAGAGGLLQAAELLRNKVLQAHELQVFERDSNFGGVWQAAKYPGAACDVPSAIYQISWHRNTNPSNCLCLGKPKLGFPKRSGYLDTTPLVRELYQCKSLTPNS